jgi:hypothetical protein
MIGKLYMGSFVMHRSIDSSPWRRFLSLAGGAALVLLCPMLLLGQGSDGRKSAEASKGKAAGGGSKSAGSKADAAKAGGMDSDEPAPGENADDQDEVHAGVDASKMKRTKTGVEHFSDPNVEAAMPNKFQEIVGLSRFDSKPLEEMIRGVAPIDRGTIQKFITAQAVGLTSHRNIDAWLAANTGATTKKTNPNQAVEISNSTKQLLLILNQSEKNPAFRSIYLELLRSSLVPLLERHLATRFEAMVVLSKTGDPELIGVFTTQIENPRQLIGVKMLAARGITRITNRGQRLTVNPQEAIRAAKALTAFLETEKDTVWFAQLRALEALGSLRFSAVPLQGQGKAEMANEAMRFVADPDARLEVRAMACWALGWMRYTQQDKPNFDLIARGIGEVTVDIGKMMLRGDDDHVRGLLGIIVTEILPAFTGSSNVADSGLFNSAKNTSSTKALTEVYQQIKSLGLVARKLMLVPRTNPKLQKDTRSELEAQVNALSELLVKIAPKDNHLTPSGPAFQFGGAAPSGVASTVRRRE